MKTTRRLLVGALVSLTIISLVGPARAAWNVTASGRAYAKAIAMPGGNTPTASVSGRNVWLSWNKVSFAGGAAVEGYRVRRYDSSSGAAATIGNSCGGLITTLTCTESAVPPGTWRYSITPVHHNWVGAEGARSSVVTVGGPSMAFSSATTVTALPTTLNGNLKDFVSGTTITFRLDDPATGTLLSGSTNPTSISSDGTATFSVSIPKGTSNGSRTVYAVGGQGDVASSAINVSVPAPTPTDVQVANGSVGQTGRPDQGDTVKVTYSEVLDVSSLCSTWSGNSTAQSLAGDNVVRVTINDNAVSGNDQMVITVVGACGNTFRFGSINLGSPSFVSGATTFSGTGTAKSTITWDPGLRQLVVTLGAKSAGPNPTRVNTSVTATYTPDPGILNPSGRAITGTVSRSAIQF